MCPYLWCDAVMSRDLASLRVGGFKFGRGKLGYLDPGSVGTAAEKLNLVVLILPQTCFPLCSSGRPGKGNASAPLLLPAIRAPRIPEPGFCPASAFRRHLFLSQGFLWGTFGLPTGQVPQGCGSLGLSSSSMTLTVPRSLVLEGCASKSCA